MGAIYNIETIIPLKKTFRPGMLFRFSAQVLQRDAGGRTLLMWPQNRMFRDVSRLGLAVCK